MSSPLLVRGEMYAEREEALTAPRRLHERPAHLTRTARCRYGRAVGRARTSAPGGAPTKEQEELCGELAS
jgi:hypothetical protein